MSSEQKRTIVYVCGENSALIAAAISIQLEAGGAEISFMDDSDAIKKHVRKAQREKRLPEHGRVRITIARGDA